MASNLTERAWACSQKNLKNQQQTAELFSLYRSTPTIPLRNKIALLNDKLAIGIARRYQERCDMPLDDLIQFARIGLIRAVEKFDPTNGAAFSSFAVPFIKGEIQHFMRDRKGLMKTPRRWQEKSDEVRLVQQKLSRSGRVVSLDEAATKGLQLPRERWETISHATQYKPLVSLEDEALQVAAEEGMSLEEREEMEVIQEALMQRLGQLPTQTQQCIVERFWGNLSDEVIAKRQSLSVPEIQLLIADGLRQLRTGDLSQTC